MITRALTKTTLALLASVIAVLAWPSSSRAENLTEVLRSPAMRKVDLSTQIAHHRKNSRHNDNMSWFNGMDPRSKFALIWANSRGPLLLQSWIGADIVDHKLVNSLSKRYQDMVVSDSIIFPRSKRIAVRMRMLIPHPTYRSMVEYNTMSEFNELQPPTLRIVASEPLEFNGQKGTYYRAERGGCSILFKLSQHAVLNLSVTQCENSDVMMNIAKHLTFSRLNQKLDS
jgi:hypothetical protein